MSSSNAFAALASTSDSQPTINVDETSEHPTTQQTFEAIGKDSQLLLSAGPFPTGYPQSRTQLFAISPDQSQYAYATSTHQLCTGPMQDLHDKLSGLQKKAVEYTAPKVQPVGAPITHLAYTSSSLVVATETNIAILTHDLVQTATTSLDCPLLQLVPNPVDDSIAFLGTDGKLRVSSTSIADTCTAIAWSQRGKQLIAGHSDGYLRQYTPSGALKASLPPPSASVGKVNAVAWLENNLFCILYSAADDELALYLLRRNPSSTELNYTLLYNASGSWGDTSHPPFYTIMPISKTLLLTASTTSADIGLISTVHNATLSFTTTSMMRYSVERDVEVSLVGIAIETRGTEKIVWVADNDGGLSAWKVIDSEHSLVEDALEVTPAVQATAAQVSASPFSASAAQAVPSPFSSAFAPSQTNSPFAAANPTTTPAQGAFSTSSNAFGSTAPAFGASSAFGKPSAFGSSAFGGTPTFGGFGTPTQQEKPNPFAGMATATEPKSPGFATSAFGSSAFGKGSASAFTGFPSTTTTSAPARATPSEPKRAPIMQLPDSDEEEGEDKLADIDAKEPQTTTSGDAFNMGGLGFTGAAAAATPTEKTSVFGKPGGFTFPSAQAGGFGFGSAKPAATTTGGSMASFGFGQGSSSLPAMPSPAPAPPIEDSPAPTGASKKVVDLPAMPAPAPAPPIEEDAPLPPSPKLVKSPVTEDAPLPPDPTSVKTALPDVSAALRATPNPVAEKKPFVFSLPSTSSSSTSEVKAESGTAVHDEVKQVPPFDFTAVADATPSKDDDFAKFSEEEGEFETDEDAVSPSKDEPDSGPDYHSDHDDSDAAEDSDEEEEEASDATQSEEEYEPSSSAFGPKAAAFQFASSTSSEQRASPFAPVSEHSRPGTAFSGGSAFDFRKAPSVQKDATPASPSAAISSSSPVAGAADAAATENQDAPKTTKFSIGSNTPAFDFTKPASTTSAASDKKAVEPVKTAVNVPAASTKAVDKTQEVSKAATDSPTASNELGKANSSSPFNFTPAPEKKAQPTFNFGGPAATAQKPAQQVFLLGSDSEESQGKPASNKPVQVESKFEAVRTDAVPSAPAKAQAIDPVAPTRGSRAADGSLSKHTSKSKSPQARGKSKSKSPDARRESFPKGPPVLAAFKTLEEVSQPKSTETDEIARQLDLLYQQANQELPII
ncbi:hypothetical protein BCR37DRAFT_1102 [Protomyces lactucae-debilis]|uniref:Nucleoporin Nup159/Nup146 N-terminal domain-containing protein n=1 Tax=Protomyces lactucae-debilis TaxID=2754530 RepID=A0A1Y2FVH4_PROLT|nr:uncharacterized protein BCR37DRAFT_1102 [Protomyces lactucae-debilis]ORY87567.1 hypothetical protein BCR37DRAFT_1102 [Protomyces lactucae-debilis]